MNFSVLNYHMGWNQTQDNYSRLTKCKIVFVFLETGLLKYLLSRLILTVLTIFSPFEASRIEPRALR